MICDTVRMLEIICRINSVSLLWSTASKVRWMIEMYASKASESIPEAIAFVGSLTHNNCLSQRSSI
jgi:hypothetical protein